MTNTTTQRPEIHDFITIPAWRVTGLVVATRPASLGSDEAVEVLVEAKPDDPRPSWYRLEPSEWSFA